MYDVSTILILKYNEWLYKNIKYALYVLGRII